MIEHPLDNDGVQIRGQVQNNLIQFPCSQVPEGRGREREETVSVTGMQMQMECKKG